MLHRDTIDVKALAELLSISMSVNCNACGESVHAWSTHECHNCYPLLYEHANCLNSASWPFRSASDIASQKHADTFLLGVKNSEGERKTPIYRMTNQVVP